MANFKTKANNATKGSKVPAGRDKMTTAEIIEKYPDGVTITEFDLLNSKRGGRYAVCAFVEDYSKFFCGGTIMTQICESWAEDFESCEEASAALKAEGGVKCRLYHSKTQKGNDIIKVDIVD